MFGAAVLGPIAHLIVAAVSVHGATTCPTPAAVDARLRPLLPSSSAASGNDDVRLEREGPALHIALYSADGRLAARRTIEGPHSCEALAEAAAVIVAAWKTDVGARPLLAADAATPAADLQVALTPALPGRSPAAAWGLSAGGGVSMAGASPAPAAALTVVHAPVPASAWAGRLGAIYQGARESSLAVGKLRWQRWMLELGPQVQGGAGLWGGS